MVYVVQNQIGKDISQANTFGKLVILLEPGLQINGDSSDVTNKLFERLVSFSDEDYLLLIGDPVAIGLSVAIAAEINNGQVNLLKWDRRTSRYLPIMTQIKKGEFNGNFQ